MNFNGVKIALINNQKLLVIQRDNKPGLRNANLWDFPGGGREGNESQMECAIRETKEELGIEINPKSIIWSKTYPSMHDPGLTAYFMVAKIDSRQINSIVFGDEGQGWKMITIKEFLDSDVVVEQLKGRLNDYLNKKY